MKWTVLLFIGFVMVACAPAPKPEGQCVICGVDPGYDIYDNKGRPVGRARRGL